MNKSVCAPGKGTDRISCLSKDSLIKIIKAYNKQLRSRGGGSHSNNQNPISIKNKSKKQLWENLREKMSGECNKEVCWIDRSFVRDIRDPDILDNTFKPKQPESWKIKKNTWLTTSDINSVMKQYENKHPDFLFIGPVAVDCPGGYYCELTNFDFSRLGKINKVGIVYNLDPHYKGGSHWVGLYIDKKKNQVNYYDSYGHAPPKQIKSFMNQVGNQLNEYNKKNNINQNIKLEYNKVRHQYGGSECGVYSMNFIIQSLKGRTFKYIQNKKFTDKQMLEMRDILYRK
jgi:hypothetical protein